MPHHPTLFEELTMKTPATLITLTAIGFLALATPSGATDTDPGDDCVRPIIEDWGDAPEGVLAYPGVIGRFPTCRDMSLVGTQEIPAGCFPISTPPAITGHIFHLQGPNQNIPSYWLGCYTSATGERRGIDREGEGLTNQPAQGSSFCNGEASHCAETAYGLTWDQDECYGDGSDAGLSAPPALVACQSTALTVATYNCSDVRVVYLNILVDMNHDGDWNDADLCGTLCVYEWAVKNEAITLPPGCGSIISPSFPVGPDPGPAWLRISLTEEPVTDDYPWAGGAGQGGVRGGETEDYPALVEDAVPTESSTWGKVKSMYR
jgi:hypothetical protein